jgi:hypothetical protein
MLQWPFQAAAAQQPAAAADRVQLLRVIWQQQMT